MIHKETTQNYKNKKRKKRREKEKWDLPWIKLPEIQLSTSYCTNLLPLRHVEKYDLSGNNIWFNIWTFVLPSMWLQLPWWKIVWCFKSRLYCTRLYTVFKVLEVSEVFLSFTCIFKSKLSCMLHFMSHKKRSGEISNGDAIAYGKNSNSGQAVKLQVKFPAEKNTLNICRHWWLAIQLPMDIHKQAVKNKLASRMEKWLSHGWPTGSKVNLNPIVTAVIGKKLYFITVVKCFPCKFSRLINM